MDCQSVRILRTLPAMSVGDIHPLRAWRLAQDPKLTLDAAAAAVGTVRSTWHDWETGRRLPGDRDTYQRILRFTRGEITPDKIIFPFGLPVAGQMALPFDPPTPTPLLESMEVDAEPERLVA